MSQKSETQSNRNPTDILGNPYADKDLGLDSKSKKERLEEAIQDAIDRLNSSESEDSEGSDHTQHSKKEHRRRASD